MSRPWATDRTALLTMDCQVDICRRDGRFVGPIADETERADLLSVIRRVQDAARTGGVPVVHVRHVNDPVLDERAPRLMRAMKQANACQPGSAGVEIVSEVAPLDGELVVDKQRISAFAGTNLDRWLRSLGIDTVVLTGITTTFVVEGTARDAVDRGFRILLTPQTSVCMSEQSHERSLTGPLSLLGTVENVAGVSAWLAGQRDAPGGGRGVSDG